KLEDGLNATIGELEKRLEDSESVLAKRNAEIANLKMKAEEAEKRAQALKTQVEATRRSVHTKESGHNKESALKKKLDHELNARISELEDRLKERESLLEKRIGEVAAFKLKAEEAEKKAHALKTQVEETQRGVQTKETAFKKKVEEGLN